MAEHSAHDRAHYLQEIVALFSRLTDDGYTHDEIREMVAAALAHVSGGDDVPHARGTCVSYGAVHLAWSEYQWALLVRAPCRSCGRLW